MASGVATQAADQPLWPDAPPAQLKEELFGIRFYGKLEGGGPDAAAKFLRAELKRDPQPHTKAFVAWISLFSEAWKIPAIVDPVTARKLAEEAEASGSRVAADVLGRAQIYGMGMDRDLEAGLTLLKKAADGGLPRAIGRLGFFKLQGVGSIPRDIGEGYRLVALAAARGSTVGLEDAAGGYETGRIASPVAQTQALYFYVQLALQNTGLGWKKLDELAEKGAPGAVFYRAFAKLQFANDGGWIAPSVVRKQVEALETMRTLDARAWVELGVAHLEGVYAKRDYPKALDYLRRAATAGWADAKFYLAYAKLRGFGMPRDSAGALIEIQALADAGNARAASKLGWIYYWGASDIPGVTKNETKAFDYSRRAAEMGHLPAVVNLGFCYEHGIGVKENPVLAAKVYQIAMDRGVSGARERLRRNLAFAKIP